MGTGEPTGTDLTRKGIGWFPKIKRPDLAYGFRPPRGRTTWNQRPFFFSLSLFYLSSLGAGMA